MNRSGMLAGSGLADDHWCMIPQRGGERASLIGREECSTGNIHRNDINTTQNMSD